MNWEKVKDFAKKHADTIGLLAAGSLAAGGAYYGYKHGLFGNTVENQPEPKVETKVEPKVETKVEPKVETKVETKVEPKVAKNTFELPPLENALKQVKKYSPVKQSENSASSSLNKVDLMRSTKNVMTAMDYFTPFSWVRASLKNRFFDSDTQSKGN